MKNTTIFLALCLLTNLVFAQQKLPEDIVQSIQKRIDYGHTPSIVVGIIDKDGPQYYAFGSKTIGGQPVNEHTIYEIGSISKTFTAILMAQMEQEGNLKTDDAAQNYLPESVRLPVKDGKKITLGHLSDHTSGLARMPDNFAPKDPANPYSDYTVELMYDFLNNYTLTRDIGSAMEYSNLAAGLLGHILSLKSGMSYEDLVANKIALPLGMKATKITFDNAMKQNLAMGHSNGVQVSNWDIPTLAGAGAIRSSLYDMLRYVAANMGLQKSALQAAMQLTHQPRHDKAGGGTRVGLGWIISKGEKGDIYWHNGGTGGYRTFIGFVKETGKGVVVLTNSDKGADDLGMHLLNPSAKLIEVKRSGIAVIKETLETKGLAAALKTYDALKKENTTYEFDEEAINSLGYTYMGYGQMTEALALLKINVDEFPKSFNAYDSYAEALMKDGQKDAAIANFKKSLELNPNNTNATVMLARIGAAAPLHVAGQSPTRQPIREVTLSGTGYQLGLQHGQIFKKEIGELVAKFKEKTTKELGKDANEVLADFYQKTSFDAAIKQWTPEIYEEVRGIADGAGQSFNDVMVFSLLDEFWVYQDNIENHHCSGVGVPARNGQPGYIAQNMDIESYTDGYQVLLRIARNGDRPEQLILTHPGCIALNGMNEAGIGACMNTLMQLKASTTGLPVAFIVRRILSSTEKSEVLNFIQNVPHASGQNYIIGIKGKVYDFEASANKVVRFDPKNENGTVWHTNHPLVNDDLKEWFKKYDPTLKEEDKPVKSNSFVRLAAVQRRVAPSGTITDATIKEALRSKDDAKFPVCVAANQWGLTFGSVIMTLTGKPFLQITSGPPDESAYKRVDFSEKHQTAPLSMKQTTDGKWIIIDRKKTALYDVFLYDNGPDYESDGLIRVVKNGKIGYADAKTYVIVIEPQFDCAFPFEGGKARVSNQCKTVKDGEHSVWESNAWQYVDKQGKF